MPLPILIAGIAGSNLATNKRLLAEGVGVMALDLEPGRGDFRPLYVPLTVATVPTSPQRLTIWRMGRDVVNDAIYWLSWTTRVSATLGVGSDSTEITFYTGDGTPKWTSNAIAIGSPPYPQASRELAVPAPSAAVTMAINVNGSGLEGTRYYVETFVNDRGWESAPSPVSAGLVCRAGATVDLTLNSTPPAGNYGFTARRIYRTQPGSDDEAEFLFLREVSVGTTTTTDDNRALDYTLPTWDGTTGSRWEVPPATGHSLLALWSSMFAMLDGKWLYLSAFGTEVPYGWRNKDRKPLRDTGVALATWGANLLALTTGRPVVFNGTEPENLLGTPGQHNHPCRSAFGVVSWEHGAAWPSSEGLAYMGDRGAALLTQHLLTTKQWKALNPDTMVAGRWGRFYVCSYVDGAGPARKAFALDPLAPQDGIWWLSDGFDACHYDDLSQELYILQGGNVRKFNGGATRYSASFTSKEHLQTHPVQYEAVKVQASGYPVTVEIIATSTNPDGSVRTYTEILTVANADARALNDGFMADGWSVKQTSAFDIQSVRLASNIRHLKGRA